MENETILIKEFIKQENRLIDRNLVIGLGGNISFRLRDIMYITLSGSNFNELNR